MLATAFAAFALLSGGAPPDPVPEAPVVVDGVPVAREEIERRAFPTPAARVRLVAPHFGDDVSLVGSAALVAERIDDPAFRRSGATAPAIPGQT